MSLIPVIGTFSNTVIAEHHLDVKAEMIDRDRPFTYRVTTNYFTMVRKCGPLSKYRDGLMGTW